MARTGGIELRLDGWPSRATWREGSAPGPREALRGLLFAALWALLVGAFLGSVEAGRGAPPGQAPGCEGPALAACASSAPLPGEAAGG